MKYEIIFPPKNVHINAISINIILFLVFWLIKQQLIFKNTS